MQFTLKNRTIFCKDNIDILQNIDSDTIDLIYLDPPFNKKRSFHAPIGSKAEGASFKDTWYNEDLKLGYIGLMADKYPKLHKYVRGIEGIESHSHRNYLIYMAQRLIEMRRILKQTGSIYLHCDNTMASYLELLMDCIFGSNKAIGHIVWKRHTSMQKGSQYKPKSWGVTNDDIFHYVKSDEYYFVNTREIKKEEVEKKFPFYDEKKKDRYNKNTPLFRGPSMGDSPNLCYEWKGFRNLNPSGWRLSKDRLEEEYRKGNIVITRENKIHRRKYLKDYIGVPMGNLWTDILPPARKERTGYPTQKPLKLLERIIKASSKEGDIVLDPFCGCATTCIAAEKLHRQWIGIDVSPKAYQLIKTRLSDEVEGIHTDGRRDMFKFQYKVIYREDIPQRTDIFPEVLSYTKDKIEIKHLLYEKQEGNCKGCAIRFEYRHLTIDHILPRVKGGGDNIANLQLLCHHCNSIKGDRTMEYLFTTLNNKGIGIKRKY